MKYVIWGCGQRGEVLFSMLEKTRKVVAIIEGNRELHGSTYRNIPIISFDEFLLRYSEYPVIVTPRNFEDEIMEQLRRKNIIGAFPFSKDIAPMKGLMLQLPISQTLKRYKGNDSLAIYGISLLSLVLYDLFLENGFDVSLMMPSDTDNSLKRYVKEILKLKTVSADDVRESGMKLLLATELEEKDHSELYGLTCDTYYDLHLQDELFYKPELERFRNIYAGKRCFIVATGPSLRIDDLDTLYHNGEVCISVNGIFKAFGQTKWRPDYYVVVDPIVSKWKKEILEMDIQVKFVSDAIFCFDDEYCDNIYRWHLIDRSDSDGLPGFSDDFAHGGYLGMTVIYDGALQLAAYMGFKEIYLLGTDCTVSPDGKTPHFVPDYGVLDDRDCLKGNPWLEAIMRSYQVAKQYADSHGIRIYNATRGGNLEIFPRVDFDALFNG